jgi:hypothetical protein
MSRRIKCDVRSRRAALWRRMSGDALEEGGREASLRISGARGRRHGVAGGFPEVEEDSRDAVL